MAKDMVFEASMLDTLSAAEVERIEAFVFTIGGPPETLNSRTCLRATTASPPRQGCGLPVSHAA
jgi:hypothetical protein